MASPEDVRGRAMSHALRATIAVVAVLGAVLAGLAACASPHHGTPAGSAPSGAASAAPSASTSHQVGGVHTSAPPQHVKTQMRTFAPFDEAGVLTVDTTKDGTGSCWTTSIAVPVAGVFRCLVANEILDPCFAPVHETKPATVACFSDPWSPGRIVTVKGGLPDYNPVLTTGTPWAIELVNGVHCVVVTGAVPSLGNVDLSYHCGSGQSAGVTTSSDGSLTAQYGPSTGPLTAVGVSVAWRGRSYRFAGTN